MVLATLSLLEEGIHRFPAASYFTLLSGQDYPIKNAEHINHFFQQNDSNFIRHAPLREERWQYGGIRRINKYYWAKNRKSIPGFFFRTISCPPRRFPVPLEKIHVGSQWWVLKRNTVVKVLDFVKKIRIF
jgi:Core-2/I-Branching enzyme